MTDALPDHDAFDAGEELSFDAPIPAPRKRRPPKRRPEPDAVSHGEGAAVCTSGVEATTVEPAALSPSPSHPGPNRRTELLLGGMAALSCLASFASFGAVATVGRTLAAAQADRAQAAEDRRSAERLPATIAALDQAAARLAAVAERMPRAPGATGLGVDDLHRGLDDLKLALATRRPEGVSALAGMTHDGFAETGTRLDRIEAAVARLSADRRAANGPCRVRPS